MTFRELCDLLELPQEVILRLITCAQPDLDWLTEDLRAKYYTRATSGEGLEAIRARLGDDPDGFRMLWVMLQLACEAWDGYTLRGISREIFTETMKFITRFLRTGKEQTGSYTFTWGWWFWRQLSLVEFRIGCLEYELVENADGTREISLHIPSDADLRPASVDDSFAAFRTFLAGYFPDWQDAPWICDSWMMSPALENLLGEGSNILAFQRRFDRIFTNEGYEGALDWVFPTYHEVSEALPEKTSLQRKMKAWLLAGNKVGWTKAVLRQ